MSREILYKGKDLNTGIWMEGYPFRSWDIAYISWGTADRVTHSVEVYPDSLRQYTGVRDSNNVRIFEGDLITFWACYGTYQTHTGPNIPFGGSYTEPDEPVFQKVVAKVVWEEDTARWGFSIRGEVPPQFESFYNSGWWEIEMIMPILHRVEYSLEEIKQVYGYEDIKQEDWLELLQEAGFTSEEEMMESVNKITVIGVADESFE